MRSGDTPWARQDAKPVQLVRAVASALRHGAAGYGMVPQEHHALPRRGWMLWRCRKSTGSPVRGDHPNSDRHSTSHPNSSAHRVTPLAQRVGFGLPGYLDRAGSWPPLSRRHLADVGGRRKIAPEAAC